MYGASHLTSAAGVVMILAGITGLTVFAFIELKTEHPLLDIGLFKENSVFLFSNAAALINYSATFAIGFLLSLYLQYIKGLSPHYAGYILVSQPLIQALLSPVAGKLSDMVEPRLVASAGMVVTIIGLVIFAFLTVDTPIWLIVGNLVLFGIGFGLFSSPNTNAIMSSVDRSLYGVASALVGTMRLTGQVVSMAIVTLIFSYHIGFASPSAENLPQLMTSMKYIFLVFVLLCIAGLLASLVRGNLRNKDPLK
jgi:MFS family permease